MPRFIVRVSLAVSVIALNACSQPPAPVDNKGGYHFGRNGVDHSAQKNYASQQQNRQSNRPAAVYANNASNLSQPTTQSASVQSIGVSDLPPPSAPAAKPVAAAPAAKPQTLAKAAPVPQAKVAPAQAKAAPVRLSTDAPARINPWTNRPHFSSSASPAKPKQLSSSNNNQSYIWPVNSKKVVSDFGPKGSGKANDGINIASANGEPVWAAADGEVIYVGNELSGYGNMVIVKHAGGKNTTYAHLNDSTVEKYDRVKQGDIIGYVGNTGNVKNPQLHFAIRDGKTPLDPEKYLSRSVAGL